MSVVGTPAFMDFVESIKGEGVILEKKAMGAGAKPIAPMVIEVDKDNPNKDIDKLDIEIPVMSPRIQRSTKILPSWMCLSLEIKSQSKNFFGRRKTRNCFQRCCWRKNSPYNDTFGRHRARLSKRCRIFAQAIMRELRLFGCYDILFGKVREFCRIICLIVP